MTRFVCRPFVTCITDVLWLNGERYSQGCC